MQRLSLKRRNEAGQKKMIRELVTPPAPEQALTLAEAKAHLRVDHTDDDDYIAELIKSAFYQAETKTWRALLTQTWDIYFDNFPFSNQQIILPKPPLVTVDSIKYQDNDDNEQTWSDTEYVVDTVSEPGRVYPVPNGSYPSAYLKPKSVVIQFTAGYTTIPDEIKHWLKVWIADAYDVMRQSYFQGGAFNVQVVRQKQFADNLLYSYKVGPF